MLSAQNVPAGVTVQFDPPSTTGNVSRMLLLSNGLPFVSADYDIIVRGTSSLGVYGTATFQLRVNPGIVWADQFGAPNNAAFDPDFATDVVMNTRPETYMSLDLRGLNQRLTSPRQTPGSQNTTPPERGSGFGRSPISPTTRRPMFSLTDPDRFTSPDGRWYRTLTGRSSRRSTMRTETRSVRHASSGRRSRTAGAVCSSG